MHGARLTVELDPGANLPRTVEAFDDVFTVRFTNLRYGSSHDVPFLTHMTADLGDFTFDRASFEEHIPAAPSKPKRHIGFPIKLPLIQNRTAPNSRGVLAMIGGHRFRMLLDSGNNATLLSIRAASQLGKLRSAGELYAVTSFGVSKVPLKVVPDITLGALHLKNETVAITSHTYGYDGVIGLSLFSLGYVSLAGNTVVIEPSRSRTGTITRHRHLRWLANDARQAERSRSRSYSIRAPL